MVLEKPTGKKGEAWRVGLADGRILPLAIDNAAAQRKLTLHDVVLVRVTEGKGKSRCARRVARAAGGAGHGGGPGEQDRPHPRDDRRLLLPAEPAQPRHPGGAPARLRHQAAQLSRGAAQGPAAQHAGQRRADHAAADRRRPRPRAGLLDAEELRRRRRAAFSPCAARSRTRAISRPCICSMAASRTARRRASTACAGWPWKRRSIANACATIRSCSAPSRCGRSISRRSMRRSPTKACARRRYVVESIERNGLIVYRHDPKSAVTIGSVDRAAFYQLKTMLQGVLARGTARVDRRPRPLRRRQDRHLRRGERRLVRGLHQRRHGRGLDRLRQCQRQAPHARRRRDRRRRSRFRSSSR